MFHQTNDAELFQSPAVLQKMGCRLEGNRSVGKDHTFLPLYEAKMIEADDHRAASVVIAAGNWVRQGQTEATTPVQHQNPEFVAQPRWWVEEVEVAKVCGAHRPADFNYKDVTNATNERTMIAALIPHVAVVNSAPLMLTEDGTSPRLTCCLLGNLNSFVLDFAGRQKVGGILELLHREPAADLSAGALRPAVSVGPAADIGDLDFPRELNSAARPTT